jgi:valyl-tRNA synthetase
MASFVTQNLSDMVREPLPLPEQLDLPSAWILSRMNNLVELVQRLFDTYQYGEAGRQIDSFLWGEFADWYIEISKHWLYNGTQDEKRSTLAVLLHVLDTCLRLLHPYMPFVTEEIWRYLPTDSEACILARWPQSDAAYFDAEAERKMALLMELVRGLRLVREQYGLEPSRKVSIWGRAGSQQRLLQDNHFLFSRLANVSDVRFLGMDDPEPSQAASVVAGEVTIYLPLAELIDIDAERRRLATERQRLDDQIARAQAMLGNEQFVQRARPEVVERERAKLADLQSAQAQVTERLKALDRMV